MCVYRVTIPWELSPFSGWTSNPKISEIFFLNHPWVRNVNKRMFWEWIVNQTEKRRWKNCQNSIKPTTVKLTFGQESLQMQIFFLQLLVLPVQLVHRLSIIFFFFPDLVNNTSRRVVLPRRSVRFVCFLHKIKLSDRCSSANCPCYVQLGELHVLAPGRYDWYISLFT